MAEVNAESAASSESIRGSVIALLSNIIDYAGLLPPAELDMADALAKYAACLAGDDAWLLERLVIPAARLDEFEAHAAAVLPKGEDDEPWQITALAAPAGSEQLPADLDRIAQFNQAHEKTSSGAALIDFVQIAADSASSIDQTVDLIDESLFPFFEFAVGTDTRGMIAALVGSDAGATIRAAGRGPNASDLARFLAACAAADVPFTAAAGFDRPLTHASAKAGQARIGFVNLFIAAALALNAGLEERELAEVLSEESIEVFTFEPGALVWRDRHVSSEQIEDARLACAISFAACSFDEPREGLLALGLL
jgi:hypothetical protein